MYGNEQEGYGLYQQSDLAIQAAAANPHQLVLMLFRGMMDELVRAKSHIAARRYERKAQSINKCIDILNALTSSLDFDKGGELALSLGYSWIESAVMAGVKLVPFGQQAAQQLIIDLSDHFAAGFEQAFLRGDDALGAATPLSAIASARHETQYSRLFRS